MRSGQFWTPLRAEARGSPGRKNRILQALPAAAGELVIMAGKLPSRNFQGRTPARPYTVLAFSSNFDTRQALVFESLRVAMISTRSPSLHSLFSSCTWYFA